MKHIRSTNYFNVFLQWIEKEQPGKRDKDKMTEKEKEQIKYYIGGRSIKKNERFAFQCKIARH